MYNSQKKPKINKNKTQYRNRNRMSIRMRTITLMNSKCMKTILLEWTKKKINKPEIKIKFRVNHLRVQIELSLKLIWKYANSLARNSK